MELLPQISRFSTRALTLPRLAHPQLVIRALFMPPPAVPVPLLGSIQQPYQITTPGPADLFPVMVGGVGKVPSIFVSWASIQAQIVPPPPPTPGFPVVTKTQNYAVLASDTQTTFDNSGALGPVIFSLPPFLAGLRYSFVVAAPQTFDVLAAAGNSIAIGTGESSMGGSVQSALPYSFLSLIAPNGGNGQWVVAGGMTGSWSLS